MSAALIASMMVALFVPIFLTTFLSPAEQEKARARRMAEHKRNARLLRLDI